MMAFFLVFGTVMVLAEGTAEGDTYPSRPIKVYVPYSAGGSSDLLARSLNSVASNYFDVPLLLYFAFTRIMYVVLPVGYLIELIIY